MPYYSPPTAERLSGVPARANLVLSGTIAPTPTAEIDIGDDMYMFFDTTPPTTDDTDWDGYVWVYAGANMAAARTNLVKAINGVIDPAVVTRTAQNARAGTNVNNVVARDDEYGNGVSVVTADAIGGTPAASTSDLTLYNDIDGAFWDTFTGSGVPKLASGKDGTRSFRMSLVTFFVEDVAVDSYIPFGFPFYVKDAWLNSCSNAAITPPEIFLNCYGRYVYVNCGSFGGGETIKFTVVGTDEE